ncbi:unnamed protein product [Rotaria sp. Silwood1]|nr:unnamed protein product [Rotaria sp. Silwood1]
MTSNSYCCAFKLILFTVIISIVIADISSDVKYLRQQYNAGKNEANQIIIQYQDKRIHDEDLLKKADTQIAPHVQINVKTDPKMPFFTLLMVDPDAPQRGNEIAGPWLHWIKASFKENYVNSGTTLGFTIENLHGFVVTPDGQDHFNLTLNGPPVRSLGDQVKVEFKVQPNWYYNGTHCANFNTIIFDGENWQKPQRVDMLFGDYGCCTYAVTAVGGGYEWQYRTSTFAVYACD